MFSYLDISRLLRISPESPELTQKARSLSIDTRTLQAGDLFVAFKGEHSDGHSFLISAFEKGASGALVDKKRKDVLLATLRDAKVEARNLFAVPDPQAAMTLLAAEYRKTLSVNVVGITGSVGKTTTKEFLFYLLRQKYSVLATAGNLNNHLGVPIMLSRLEPSHQYAVMEMGASHQGEIHDLAALAVPSSGILTPIGAAHLEGFGSLENVYKTKLELADFLKRTDPLVVPAGVAMLLRLISERGRAAVTVGACEGADYRISDVKVEDGFVVFQINGEHRFAFPGQAPFLSLNAGLAIAMVRSLGFSWKEIPSRWDDVGFASGRFRETILANGVRVIDDSYNANPVSFENALAAFQLLPVPGKKVVVFADMRELGSDEARFHRELGEKIAASGINHAFAYGSLTRLSIDAARDAVDARHFEDGVKTLEALKLILRPGDAVLFKGSRSMHVEKVLEGVRTFSFLS